MICSIVKAFRFSPVLLLTGFQAEETPHNDHYRLQLISKYGMAVYIIPSGDMNMSRERMLEIIFGAENFKVQKELTISSVPTSLHIEAFFQQLPAVGEKFNELLVNLQHDSRKFQSKGMQTPIWNEIDYGESRNLIYFYNFQKNFFSFSFFSWR